MVSTPVLCRGFVGRAEELAHLVARRRAARESKGGTVLVGGEPGIGKSRLLTEFIERTAHGTARVVRAECRPFAQSPLGPLYDALSALECDMGEIRGAATPEDHLAALLRAFARASDRRAIVVTIEDLHWADPELLATLRLLTMRAGSQRLLFVGTYRDNEIVPDHRAFVAFGALLREASVSSVRLGAFAASPMVELLSQAASGTDILPAVVREVARRSDGNPLIGEELLRHALDTRQRAKTVPITLHAVVRERVDRCTPRERALLVAAALCGRRFDLDTVAAVLAEGDMVRPQELDRLVDLQLVRPVANRPGSFEFRHALTRDAIEAERRAGEARPLHARIAQALSERADARDYALEIAYHLWEADARDGAVPAYQEAARVARSLFAWDEAILWYERAAAAAAPRPGDVARVTLELGKVLVAALREDEAAAAFVRVSELALSIGDVSLAVRARKLHAGMMANNGRRDAAIALLERTLPLVSGDGTSAENELVVRITSYHLMKQTTDDARVWLNRIDPAVIDPATPAAAEFFTLRGTLRAREDGDDGWRDDFGRALDVYRRRGAPMFERYLLAEFGMQAVARGDLALARRCFEQARQASSESASTRNDVPLGMATAELYAGRIGSAVSWLGRVEPTGMLQARMLRAFAGVSLGVALADDALVRAHLDPGLIQELGDHDDEYGFIRLAAAYAEGLVALGRKSDADALLKEAAARVRSTVGLLPSIATIAALRPDLSAPLERLIAERTRDPFHAAMFALIQAERFAASGDRDHARAAGLVAREGLSAAGWMLSAARAAELAGEANDAFALYREAGHIAGTRRVARPALDAGTPPSLAVLTYRERELARMVAGGKSNRAIAETMAISLKTVEKHLTSIYGKLSLQSRAQLTAYVVGAEDAGEPGRR